ncbi:hypothetical protein F7725_019031 [Dissostichus mawsoni]|uniref:Uncharacterized protein n=1 Tax=Dissostichus mawsoni TaxID=36200 RepID=A0A7J5XT73_DISMA|nr:hypothetical protein F7725_019031 [Dissostichus mawsoni]
MKPGRPPRPSISTFYWSRNISSCLSCDGETPASFTYDLFVDCFSSSAAVCLRHGKEFIVELFIHLCIEYILASTKELEQSNHAFFSMQLYVF